MTANLRQLLKETLGFASATDRMIYNKALYGNMRKDPFKMNFAS